MFGELEPPRRWLPGAGGEPDGFRPRPMADDLARLSTGHDEDMAPDRELALPYGVAASAELLRRAGPELARVPLEARIAALARVARSWLDPDDAHRREAIEHLPAELGFTQEMVAWALDAAFGVVTAEALATWWARASEPDEEQSAAVPELSAHIWSGNVFVAGLPPVLGSLLAGVPALVKAPGGHPTFGALFARSVAHHAPELGPCLGVASWGREDARSTRMLLEADVAFVFGDDASVEAVREAASPRCAVHGFGHRVSVGLVRGEVDDAALVGLLEDCLAYDGGGCLTPQWVFVEGGLDDAVALARRAASLAPEVAERLPGLPLSDDAAAKRVNLLGIAEFGGFGAAGKGWCVVALDGTPAAPPRTLCFSPIPHLTGLAQRWASLALPLQGASVLGTTEADVGSLRAWGLSLVASPGRLQRPPLDWDHDGVDILGALR